METPVKPLTGITGFLVRRFIKNYQDVENDQVRAQYGYLEGWMSVVINLFLAGVKLVLGLMIQSHSLIADAVHSMGDLVSSAIVIFGFKLAKKPRDREHPFGHENAELVASLIMAILLIIAGFELMKSSAEAYYRQEFHPIELNWITASLIILTILFKEWLVKLSQSLGKRIGSKVLDADAWHHRLDSITTVLVLLGLFGASQGVLWLDSVMGVVVSLVVIWSGIDFAKDSISPLLGENLPQEDIKEIKQLASRDHGVLNVHDIIVHKYGKNHFISLHAEIDGTLTSVQMHDIAAQASERVTAKYRGACNVHVDPIDIENERYKEVALVLTQLVDAKRELIDFHDLQFRNRDGKEVIFWEFSVDPEVDEKSYPEIKREVRFYLTNLWNSSKLVFTLEPGYNIV